jgi:hypothetical protein
MNKKEKWKNQGKGRKIKEEDYDIG